MFLILAALFIGRFEGYEATPYKDAAGYATVGYGHLITNNIWYSFDTNENQRLEPEEATALLEYDIGRHMSWEKLLIKPLAMNKKIAVASLAFNVGTNSKAIKDIIYHLNRDEDILASKVFLKYTKARIDGKLVELRGLKLRRQLEYKLFLGENK